jgi:hypothetical protein
MCRVNFQPLSAVSFCGLAGGLPSIVRQAGEFGLVAHQLGKGVGGVEQVLRELGRELRQFLGNRLKARLAVLGQLRTAEAEIANLVVDDPTLGGRQTSVFRAPGDRLVLREELEVLADLGVEAGDLGQHAVVGVAPRRDVVDRVNMTDDSPGARQLLKAIAQWRGEISPGRSNGVGAQASHKGAAVIEQLADRRLHVARDNRVEARQAGEVEQRVQQWQGSWLTVIGESVV